MTDASQTETQETETGATAKDGSAAPPKAAPPKTEGEVDDQQLEGVAGGIGAGFGGGA